MIELFDASKYDGKSDTMCKQVFDFGELINKGIEKRIDVNYKHFPKTKTKDIFDE